MNNNPKKPNSPKKPKPIMYYYITAIALILIFNLVFAPGLREGMVEEISYSKFTEMIENGQINKDTEVYQDDAEYRFTVTDDTGAKKTYKVGKWDDPTLKEKLDAAGVTYSREIPTQVNPFLSVFLTLILPIALMYFVGRQLMRSALGAGGNAMSFGKSNAKVYVKAQTGKTFEDVAGQDEAKDSLTEIVDFLHNPKRYSDIGAICPKGVLLVGPPGTGKTLLAKAVAGEANVPFFSISGSEFVEMFVGMGASKVRDLFKQAKEKAPCIVFIDEIDAIGKRRDSSGFGGNDEREQTLNQLLNEMDGFDGNSGVVILAATNRPEILDPALTRPGRFDRQVRVELPDIKGREDILRVHIKDVKADQSINLKNVAKMTAGASGADLANIINEAALRAVREGRKLVTEVDLIESVEVVIAGQKKKNAVISEKEKRMIAYHEVGHALVAAMQTGTAPVTKITIIPRTSGALGYTMQVDEEEKLLMSAEDLFSKIVTLTGGRSAEEVVFNTKTTGASNDIERATKLARAMVTRFGMTDEFDFIALETQTNQYLGGDAQLQASGGTAKAIDDKVREIISSAHEKAKDILRKHRQQLDDIAAYLLDKETITGEEFMDVLDRSMKFYEDGQKEAEVEVKKEAKENREDVADTVSEIMEDDSSDDASKEEAHADKDEAHAQDEEAHAQRNTDGLDESDKEQ